MSNGKRLDRQGMLAKFYALILVALLLGTWSNTAFGQIVIENPTLPGYNPAEQAAVRRAVDYWNDVITTLSPSIIGGGPITVTFEKDPSTGDGGGWGTLQYWYSGTTVVRANEGFIGVAAVTAWETAPNTQIAVGSRNLEKLMVHELGHVLNIIAWGLDVNPTGTQVTINRNPIETPLERWSSLLYTSDGTRLFDLPNGTVLPINPATPFTFRGTNAMAVWGDGGGIPVIAESRNIGPGSTLVHPYTPFGNMNSYYNDYTRPFFSEVELAIMQDLGHTIDRSRFFGRSLYQNNTTLINTTGFNGNGMYGIGLHVVSSGNTITQAANLTSSGYAGAGIRIENVGNTVIVDDGITVAATGNEGVGVLVTHGDGAEYFAGPPWATYSGAGAILINEGTIETTGFRGTGVWFNTDTTRFDNYGTINARFGTVRNDAIYIGSGVQVDAINFYGGSYITGNITSANAAYNTTWQTLPGLLSKTTKIDGNITIPDRTFTVTNGSILSMGGSGAVRLITADTVLITDGGTLALDTGTVGTFVELGINGTFNMLAGSTLQVHLGANHDSDHITVVGTATLGTVTPGDDIIIDLLNFQKGIFTILTAPTLNYWDNAILLFGGAALTGRVSADVDQVGMNLQLTIDGLEGNVHITWTGDTDNTWDGISETENWLYGTDYDTWFIDGDAVTFDLATGGIISIDAGGVTVADMTVSGDGDWTFSGGDIFGDERETATTLTDVNGRLTKEGTGTLTMTNDNEFRGGTVVSDGTLQIGDGGTTGSIAGNITNNNRVVFNRSDEVTYNGNISGTGSLTQAGSDKLILTGTNTHTGGTTVAATGTLQIGNGGTTGSITGNIANSGDVVFNRSDEITYSGNISGTGNLTQAGTDTLILTGNNTYTGSTTVEDGTLALSGSGSIADSSGIEVQAGATFDISGITTSTAVQALTGNGTVALGLKELIINSNLDLDANDLTLDYYLGANNASGTISVNGTVNGKTSPDQTTIVLSQWAVGTFTLMTATSGIDANDFFIDPLSFGSTRQEATLTDTGDTLTLNTISYNYNLVWTGDADGNWDRNTENWWEYVELNDVEKFHPDDYVIFTASGLNQDITVIGNGNGAVQVAGMVIEGGDYTFTGGAINGAVPALASTTYQDTTGKLEVSGGSATFYNAVNFTNGMIIAGGAAVELGDGGSFGNTMVITNNGTLRFDHTTDYTLANNVSGAGTVIKDGDGTLMLTGTNTYTGGTTVEGGTLQIGNGGTTGSIVGDIDIANNANVTFNRSNTVTFGGVIGGSGSVTKIGGGTLILAAENTYDGDTTVSAGTLQFDGVGSVAGNIVNNANVTFNRTGDVDNIISGTGNVTKTGIGTLFFTGNNTYTGLTTVAGGTLFVNGSLGGSSARTAGVDVLAGAMFGGNGMIYGNLIVRENAMFSPGNSIGTITVDGNVIFETGSTYLYEIDENNSDKLIVQYGTVTVESGAKLDVVGFDTAVDDKRYQVIELQNYASFAGLTDLTELFDIQDTWGGYFEQEVIQGDGYYITWVLTQTDFANNTLAFGTPNAIRAAEGMDGIAALGRTATGRIGTLYRALSGMPANDPQGLADAFAQLHGEAYASSKEVSVQMQRRFQALLPNGRDFHNLDALPKEWNRWGTFTGDYNNRKRLGRYSGYEASSAGFAFGVDRSVSAFGLCGVAFSYDYVDQNFRSIRSKAEIESFRAMLYGSWFNGDYYCDAYAGYSANWYTTKRDINIGTFSDTTKSKYNDDMGSLGIEIGRVRSMGGYMLTPSVGLHYTGIGSPSVTEEGGEASLYVAKGDYHSVRVPVGFKASKMFPWDHGSTWIPEVRAFYDRELANDTVNVRTAFDRVRDVDFMATSGVRGRDHLRLGLGIGFLAARCLNIRFDYDCDIYNYTSADTFAATLGVSW